MRIVSKEKLEISEIRKLFTDGIKLTSDDFKVGFEYERIPINTTSFETIPYNGIDGVCELLRTYARNENWDYILDKDNIIGLKKLHHTITLEPGCQIEMSIKPYQTIQELINKIEEIDTELIPLLDEFGITLLNYGISPLTTYKYINLLPKRRYHIMANYLWGILSDVMMRETAGIQTCFDFDSEEDAMEKFRIANMLAPITTAMFANSPIRGGVDTGYKSFRALAWLNTDIDRCGFATTLNKDFSFNDYINKVLETPLIMFSRDNKTFSTNGSITFKEFMQNGIDGYSADIEDFKLCANLYFPEVRLRKFIEIRNQDCVGKGLQYAILGFYKGILYSKNILKQVDEYLSEYTYQNFSDLRYNVPKLGLDARLNKTPLRQIAKDLVNMAEIGLKEQNNGEEKYLEPLQDLVYQGLTPADIILINWYGSWNKDLNKMIEYLTKEE